MMSDFLTLIFIVIIAVVGLTFAAHLFGVLWIIGECIAATFNKRDIGGREK